MTSKFWKDLFENLGTRLNFSSAYHPQMDGQSEIVNSTILDLLKAYVTKVDQRDQCKNYLLILEYAYNNTVHTSTKKAPFEIIEGRPKLYLIEKMLGKVFVSNKYSRDIKEFFKRLKTLYPLHKRDKRLLLISIKEPWSSRKMIGFYLSFLKHA